MFSEAQDAEHRTGESVVIALAVKALFDNLTLERPQRPQRSFWPFWS